MGDRVRVSLFVQKEHVSTIKELFNADWGDGWADYATAANPLLHQFDFDEVNYGELDDLDSLQKLGIAYESVWEAGHEFAAGMHALRFTPEGGFIRKEIYFEKLNPDITLLMGILNTTDTDALKLYELENYIRLHHAKYSYPDWDNQVAYGKRYRLNQLIDP